MGSLNEELMVIALCLVVFEPSVFVTAQQTTTTTDNAGGVLHIYICWIPGMLKLERAEGSIQNSDLHYRKDSRRSKKVRRDCLIKELIIQRSISDYVKTPRGINTMTIQMQNSPIS
jgi:hypothetical protein